MKTNKIRALVAGAMLYSGLASAQSTTNFTFNVNQAIPQSSLFGLTLATNLTVTGGNISDVTVSLDIAGGYDGNFYAYLAGPDGGFAVLLNRVGMSSSNSFGYSDSGMNVTFDDAAANGSIHFYQNVPGYSLNGTTWQPDGENIDPQSSPADFTGAQTALLNSFDDTGPNGTWTLFLADVSSGSQATLVNWSLNVVTAPEPCAAALAATLLAGLYLPTLKLKTGRSKNKV